MNEDREMKLNTSIQKPSNTKAPLHSLEFPDYDKQHYLDNMDKKYPGIECLMDGKKGVIIYGAGRMGKNFLRSLKQLNIPVTAFADTNPQLWGHPIDNVIIIPPDDIIKKYPSAPVLIASLTFESEIESKLRSMNVKYIYPLCYLNLKFPKIFISSEYEGQFNSLFDENNKTDILDAYNLWADDESKRVYKNLLEFRLTLDKHLIAQSRSDAPQYFESDIIQLSSEEVFLDCGA